MKLINFSKSARLANTRHQRLLSLLTKVLGFEAPCKKLISSEKCELNLVACMNHHRLQPTRNASESERNLFYRLLIYECQKDPSTDNPQWILFSIVLGKIIHTYFVFAFIDDYYHLFHVETQNVQGLFVRIS